MPDRCGRLFGGGLRGGHCGDRHPGIKFGIGPFGGGRLGGGPFDGARLGGC